MSIYDLLHFFKCLSGRGEEEKGRTRGREKNRQIREKTNSREERLGIKEQREVKGESGGGERGGKRG